MKHNLGLKMLALMFFLFARLSQPAWAQSPLADGNWHGTPQLGFSPYTGVIGVEILNSHFGLTVGIPASLGLKYYFDEKGTRLFVGAHAMHYEFDEDDFEDGVLYKENETTIAGAGVGYKWQWASGWNFTFSLSIVYFNETLKNSTTSRRDESVESIPGFTLGYRFH